MEVVNAISTAQAKVEELARIKDKLGEFEGTLMTKYISPIEKFLKSVSELEFDFGTKLRSEVSLREFMSGVGRKRFGHLPHRKSGPKSGRKVFSLAT